MYIRNAQFPINCIGGCVTRRLGYLNFVRHAACRILQKRKQLIRDERGTRPAEAITIKLDWFKAFEPDINHRQLIHTYTAKG